MRTRRTSVATWRGVEGRSPLSSWMRWGSPALTHLLEGVVLVASVASFCWAWGSAPLNLRERVFPKNLAEVERGWLYRSGQIGPNLIERTLRDLHIDLIVNLTGDSVPLSDAQVAERRAVEKLGIEVHRFPMKGDGVGTIEQYAAAIGVIAGAARAGKNVLVHCAAGDRRSGGVVAMYELLVRGVTPADARQELERFSTERGVETPVVRFLEEHLEEIAQRLVETGVIARLPDPIPRLPSP